MESTSLEMSQRHPSRRSQLLIRSGDPDRVPVAQRAPEDVIDLVLAHLRYEPVQWKAHLTLVCKAWLTPALSFLYSDIQPTSLRSLECLLRTVTEESSYERLIKSLSFPDFARQTEYEFADWERRRYSGIDKKDQVRHYRDVAPDEPFRLRLEAANTRFGREEGGQSTALFMELVAKCRHLEVLHLPFYRSGLSSLNAHSLQSVRTLGLLYNPAGWGTDPVMVDYGSSKTLKEVIYKLPNLETLILNGFNHTVDLLDLYPQPTSSDLQKLKTIWFHRTEGTDWIRSLLEATSDRVERIVSWPYNSLCVFAPIRWIGPLYPPINPKELVIMPHVTRLDLQIENDYPNLSRFPNLTTLLLSVKHMCLLEILDYVPDTVVEFYFTQTSQSEQSTMYFAADPPEFVGRALLAAKKKLLERSAMCKFHVRWTTKIEDLSKWRLYAFSLHEIYASVGINFSVNLEIFREL
jgi:hypothetical protein